MITTVRSAVARRPVNGVRSYMISALRATSGGLGVAHFAASKRLNAAARDDRLTRPDTRTPRARTESAVSNV